MVAEIISIGTEILLGNIVNTNAQYISKKLAFYGIDMYYQTVVGDNPERIIAAVDHAFSRADMIITTGGLGPTKDDLTKQILSEYMGYKLVRDEQIFQKIESFARSRGIFQTDSMGNQADVPGGAVILDNTTGTAPGCIMEKDGKILILLPGPPREMKPMFDACCEDYISKLSDHTIVSVCIYLKDIDHAPVSIVGESEVAFRLGDMVNASNPTIATYAKPKSSYVRITAAAPSHEAALEMIQPVQEKVIEVIGGMEYIDTIEED